MYSTVKAGIHAEGGRCKAGTALKRAGNAGAGKGRTDRLTAQNALAEEYDRLQSRLDKRYQAYIRVEADGGQSAGIHVLQSAADGSAVAGLADADGHALSLEQLENRFAGVKRHWMKNADA